MSARARVEVACLVPADALPGPEADVVALVERAVAAAGLPGAVSVALVDDARMREVNRDFHACDEPTDVLAFALGAEGLPTPADAFDYELVVSVDTARREAEERGVTARAELALYVVHGSLHLLGFDDHDADDARRMHARTREVLAGLGIENTIEVES